MPVSSIAQARKLNEQITAVLNMRRPLGAHGEERLQQLIRERRTLDEGIGDEYEERRLSAFSHLMRVGENGPLTAEHRQSLKELRDLGVGTVSTGYSGTGAGLLVPISFQNRVVDAMKAIDPIFDLATVTTTPDGRPLQIPVEDDTTVSGELLAEAQQSDVGDPGKLDHATLKSYRFGSRLVRVSHELLEDAGFNLAEYLAQRFAVRLARAIGPCLLTGSGIGLPAGVLTEATSAGT